VQRSEGYLHYVHTHVFIYIYIYIFYIFDLTLLTKLIFPLVKRLDTAVTF